MKIGIVTFFYNSTNYGGILQACALTHILNNEGFEAEQICYDYNYYPSVKFYLSKIKNKIVYLSHNWREYISDKRIRTDLDQRKNAFSTFIDKNIKYSRIVYNDKTIVNSLNEYDIFITGSDQVWSGTSNVFFLGFVPESYRKISYAASISRDVLSEIQRNKLPYFLKSYKKISVREEKARDLLNDIGINSSVVLDPTLLLSKEEWDSYCSKRLVKEKYVFCYFLGENKEYKKYVERFATEKHLKIAHIPYMNGHYSKADESFGDYRFTKSAPDDFISLIKNADYVFTDSYHATVFSCIYSKNFITFNRNTQYGNMSSRFDSLLKLLGLEHHFISDVNEINDNSINNNVDTYRNESFLKYLDYSKNFLFSNLSVGGESSE